MDINLKKMRFWCQKVIPLVYDDSLSYYETLCKVVSKINEVIEAYNGIEDEISNIVDEKISVLKEYVDKQNEIQDNNLLNFKEETEVNFNNVYEKISIEVNNLYKYINNLDDVLRIWVTNELNELKKYIDDAIFEKIMIYDPTVGYNNPLDVVINHIYDTLRYYGITCYDYDSAKITTDKYDNTHITAIKFDTLSKQIFGKIYQWYVFDYVTGVYDTVQRVLYRLFQSVRPNAISTNTYDTLNLTAESYDSKMLTGFEFDNDGIHN